MLAAIVLAATPSATAREHRATRAAFAQRMELIPLLREIRAARDETWRWQLLMRRPPTPYGGSVVQVGSRAYALWALRLWRRRALSARVLARHPPHERQWLCIHRYEGSWTDAGGPYYGGLQMNLDFQAEYAPGLLHRKGTADHWTPLEQMWVAERAYRTRGFWPWPNTARDCGLL